jgi:uncharacterized protein YjbI with pentapeptide repeats
MRLNAKIYIIILLLNIFIPFVVTQGKDVPLSVIKTGKRYIDQEFSCNTYRGYVYDNCYFENQTYQDSISFVGSRFINCHFKNISYQSSEIKSVKIDNSKIDYLEFSQCNISDLSINSSDIKQIIFKRCNISNFSLIGGNAADIIFIDCVSKDVDFAFIDFKKILFIDGELDRLKISNIYQQNKGDLKIIRTALNYPYIDASLVSSVDILRAEIDLSRFRLMNEVLADSRKYGDSKTSSMYKELRDIYYVLSKTFLDSGQKQKGFFFQFRMNECDRKANHSYIKRLGILFWDVFFRGNYGLSPYMVILTSIIVWFIFSILYYLIGKLKIVWALYMLLDLQGKIIETDIVHIFGQDTSDDKSTKFMNQYLFECMNFSFHQLMQVGFNKYGTSYIGHFGYTPKYIVPIGSGKAIVFIQRILGIVLIFNFIQAFIRIL